NEVGQPHTFTVTVLQNDGLPIGAPGGDPYNGFGAARSENGTVTLSASGAVPNPPGPFTGMTDANGQFKVTFTSATASQVVGNAAAHLTVSGVALPGATGDSQSGDSGPATKTFVDARVSIAPNATNGITEPHTFTATVLQDDGLPSGAAGGDSYNGFGAA